MLINQNIIDDHHYLLRLYDVDLVVDVDDDGGDGGQQEKKKQVRNLNFLFRI